MCKNGQSKENSIAKGAKLAFLPFVKNLELNKKGPSAL